MNIRYICAIFSQNITFNFQCINIRFTLHLSQIDLYYSFHKGTLTCASFINTKSGLMCFISISILHFAPDTFIKISLTSKKMSHPAVFVNHFARFIWNSATPPIPNLIIYNQRIALLRGYSQLHLLVTQWRTLSAPRARWLLFRGVSTWREATVLCFMSHEIVPSRAMAVIKSNNPIGNLAKARLLSSSCSNCCWYILGSEESRKFFLILTYHF